ncbi:MAG: hypothetical protein IIY71_01915 [Oscillospiraceae bacterium]|nr:hypothetical protein [Oscillospiraceae bacterium]
MNKSRYTWGAVLFFLVIFGMFFWIGIDSGSVLDSIRTSYKANRPEQPTVLDKVTLTIDATEKALNESADRAHGFIQLFGGVQKLLDKRVIEDANPENTVVRLDNGKLQFVSQGAEQVDVSAEADALISLNKTLEEAEIPLLFMAAPSKIREGKEGLPVIAKEYGNAQMDQLVDQIQQGGVETLDFRTVFDALPNFDDYFFKTDHHWRPEGAFLAFQVLCDRLRDQYGISVDSRFTDPAEYESTVYKNVFLGSQGKRIGTWYAGVDDITLIAPRFETNLTYEVPLEQIQRTGDYRDSVIFRERVEQRDYFNSNPYTMYAGGDYDLARVENHLNTNGPDIVMVRDSYACALTPFLSLACSTLETVDLRHFKGSLTDYLLERKPDMVLFLYTTATTNSPAMFQFSNS